MMNKHTEFTLKLLLTVLGFASALGALDWILARPDRIRLASAREHLQQVSDGLLLFRHDQERYPEELDELVPAYLMADRFWIEPNPGSMLTRISWNPVELNLSWPEPFQIKGLFTRRLTPSLTLPEVVHSPPPLVSLSALTTPAVTVTIGPEGIVTEAEMF